MGQFIAGVLETVLAGVILFLGYLAYQKRKGK